MRDYTILVELSFQGQALEVEVVRSSNSAEDAQRDAEEYVRDNLLIIASPAEEQE